MASCVLILANPGFIWVIDHEGPISNNRFYHSYLLFDVVDQLLDFIGPDSSLKIVTKIFQDIVDGIGMGPKILERMDQGEGSESN